MNKKSRLSYLIFAIIFCLSICTMKVMAVPNEEVPVVTEAPPVVTEAPPVVTEAPPVVTEAPTKAPVYTNPPTAAPVKPTSKPYVAPVTKSPGNSYVAPATSAYRATSAAQPATSAESKKSEIYDVEDEEVDEDTLKKGDWKDIEEQLKNANANDDSDVADFDFIKKNDGKNDNGEWILYLGIAFEVIAAGIIVTLIILAVRRKKKAENARHGNSATRTKNGSQRRESDSPGPVANRQVSEERRRTAPSHSQSRQVKKRSKYDTDEIFIPKKRTSQNNRYKPKH